MNTYLIIGASAAGIQAATKIRQSDAISTIICLAQQSDFPYNTCFLVDYMTQEKTIDQVYLKPLDFFIKNNIDLRLNTTVTVLFPDKKEVQCADGTVIKYTKLIIATGASTIVPQWKGVPDTFDMPGLFVFHTLRDTVRLIDWIAQQSNKHVVVIGAGVTGLECADALWQQGYSVTVIERGPRVLGRVLDNGGSLFMQSVMQKVDIDVRLNSSVASVVSCEGVVAGVELTDGTIIKSTTVVCALGARSNSALGINAGLAHSDGSLLVNEYMQTSYESVYAVGDVTAVLDKATGKMVRNCMWPDALMQGGCAAAHILGQEKPYSGAYILTSTHLFGYPIHAMGSVDQEVSEVSGIFQDEHNYIKKIVDSSGTVQAFVLIGKDLPISHYKRSLLLKKPLQ